MFFITVQPTIQCVPNCNPVRQGLHVVRLRVHGLQSEDFTAQWFEDDPSFWDRAYRFVKGHIAPFTGQNSGVLLWVILCEPKGMHRYWSHGHHLKSLK